MRVVMELTHELRGQNVTCDNFFTSYMFGQSLLKRNITLLGTMRKNKAELPCLSRKEALHSSKFYFTRDTAVVSYTPKKNKNFVLISTMHNSKEISNRVDKKPKMILDYNSTKGAVDTLDQFIATYTYRRKTNRWPVTVFYNAVDTTEYNAFVLWIEINPNWNKKRRIFLEELGKLLVTPYIEGIKRLPRNEPAMAIVRKIQAAEPAQSPSSSKQASKRARCKFCPSKCDNKTHVSCSNCGKHVCKVHVTYYCPECQN
ncbi:hypothetical protein J437_LFUL000472 [Ladona fulva]|uniref:PiggyBac transposable element-derived protein domain-containing protein n=1 Tax=Ladona fulva TaxID=123851 RepID=A0A8K0KJP7_LADFU|nr:hypothetical protein J437_LFUL000472 [Ladona fulva]